MPAEVQELDGQVPKLLQQGKFAEAVEVAGRVLDVRLRTFGPDQLDTTSSLSVLGLLAQRMGSYTNAETACMKALAVHEAVLGRKHPSTAHSLFRLASVDCARGNLARAQVATKFGMEIFQTVYASDNLKCASNLVAEAEISCELRSYAAAEPLLKRAFDILEKARGPEHPETVTTLYKLTAVYVKMKNFAAAEPLGERVVKVAEKVLGPSHSHTGLCLHTLSKCYAARNDYAAAESACRRALKIVENAEGTNSFTAAIVLNNLGEICEGRKNYPEAESNFRRALTIIEKTVGLENERASTAFTGLARIYCARYNYGLAESLQQRAITIQEKVLGKVHPDLVDSLKLLAWIASAGGNYEAAKPLYERALAICVGTFGNSHPSVGHSLQALASFYSQRDDYVSAVPLLEGAREIAEKTLGADHPSTASILADLGEAYYRMGNYPAAEPLYRRAFEIMRKRFGPDSPETATSLENIGGLHHARGDYQKAESFYKQVLQIREKSLGTDHPNVGDALENLGRVYFSMGNLTGARSAYERALAIYEKAFGSRHPAYASVLDDLATLHRVSGNYDLGERLCRQALAIREKAFGPDHPTTASSLDELAAFLLIKGQVREAVEAAKRVWRVAEQQRDQIFSFATESEQTALADRLRRSINAYISHAANRLLDEPEARRASLNLVLSAKGSVLEAIALRQANLRTSPNPELRRLYMEWRAVGEMLSKATMASPKQQELDKRFLQIEELEKKKEEAERVLARTSAVFASERRAFHATPSDIARHLPAGAALVEAVKYQQFLFNSKPGKKEWGDWNFAAFVVGGGGKTMESDVALVRLGSADKIEAAVKKWRKAAAPDEQGRRSEKSALDAASQELAALVWNPIVPALAGCREVYISPDGELSFVSFASLPGSKPDSFVIDDYDITYVGTGRDLVRTGSNNANAPLLVGAPDFGAVSSSSASSALSAVQKDKQKGSTADGADSADAEQKELLAMRPGISDLRSFSALTFPPLPGTRAEVESVGRLLQDRRQNPSVLTGPKADEATVKAVKHPAILHLATHGFFLPDTGLDEMMSGQDRFRSQLSGDMANAAAGKLWRQMKLKNPMHRSGIALAGANDTISGRREAGGNDGILTAEEVAGMDLWGTKMVVISACESGLGEAKGGEGVFGLRRAFTIAGAQSLVMSLWAVSDDATRQLMESLYRHLPEERTPQRALLAAQREWIAKKRAAGLYPHPVHWASFVASGIGLGLEKK
ncbi:MAG: CHAT domain-containing protein [Verrucomicrobia bacterium]|nr:CHAT domain-containing protein [Verrucomicrobiota bacterium]